MDDFLDKESGKPKNEQPSQESSGVSEKEDVPKKKFSLLEEIQNIRSLMNDNNFEEAHVKYMEAKEHFTEMTRRHLEEQNEVYSALEGVNKEMVEGLNRLRQETENKLTIIQQLIAKVYDHMKVNELNIANQLYNEIVELFKKLPEMVPEKKIKLEHEIASLHLTLTNRTNMVLNTTFNNKFLNIDKMLAFAFENIHRGNINEASHLYHTINKLYSELPKGFLYEKALMYQKILRLYKEVHHSQDKRIESTNERVEHNNDNIQGQNNKPAGALPSDKKEPPKKGFFNRFSK